MRVGIFAEEEELVLSRRMDHVAFAIEACRRSPSSRHTAIWEGVSAAYSRGIATQEEWEAYYASVWRPAFLLYKTLDPQHTRDRTMLQSVQWCLDLLRSLGDEDSQRLWEAVRFVSQEDDLKNSSGPSRNSGTPETANRSTPDTRPSTNTSAAEDIP